MILGPGFLLHMVFTLFELSQLYRISDTHINLGLGNPNDDKTKKCVFS